LGEPRSQRMFLRLNSLGKITDSVGLRKGDRIRIVLDGNVTGIEDYGSGIGWPRWVVDVDRWSGLRVLDREGGHMPRTFMDRPIPKEIVSLGISGEIKRDDGFAELPPRALVKFTATAEWANVKHTFLAKGGVKEALILTIDPKTFEVTSIEEQPEQLELGPDDGIPTGSEE